LKNSSPPLHPGATGKHEKKDPQHQSADLGWRQPHHCPGRYYQSKPGKPGARRSRPTRPYLISPVPHQRRDSHHTFHPPDRPKATIQPWPRGCRGPSTTHPHSHPNQSQASRLGRPPTLKIRSPISSVHMSKPARKPAFHRSPPLTPKQRMISL